MSDVAEPLGTPEKPLIMRATAVIRPAVDRALLEIIDLSGRRYCFELSFNQARLHASECASATAAWVLKVA